MDRRPLEESLVTRGMNDSATSVLTNMDPELAIYPFQSPATPRTLIDILEASISSHPEALAIDNGSSKLSYIELSSRIAAKVKQLHEAGVTAGDRVGIRISSGAIELYVSILAVLTAGAAYVPVDVDDPDERALLVWTEANVCAVLTDGSIITRHAVSINGEKRLPNLDNDAWIIFTSGSTGKPKGVAVTHRSAAAFVDAEAEIFLPERPLGPGDRVLAGLSVAFDASCEEMWLAWRYGACLVPAPRSLVKAGADLGTFLLAQQISVVSTVPTLAALWPKEALQGLRLLILGGEACSPELAGRLVSSVSSVWNTYGPTEATVVACASELVAGEVVRIGLPLQGWKLAVVGSDGLPVCWGETGELVIGGVGMARYLDKEKDEVKFATSAVFNGERTYRSGDLVRAEREGLLFIGRNDEQIKLGGRRIELGEIDAALMTLPGVSAAASTIHRSEVGTQILVGYVVRTHPSDSDERELLRQVLPATLVPMLVTIDDLPVRTSGKVDRKALPWPPPRSEKETKLTDSTAQWLAEQWRRVLGISVSAESQFFDCGGTSLGAAQLVSQLRQKCPAMSVADIYEHPVLTAMAARIDQLTATKHTTIDLEELSTNSQKRLEVEPTPRWLILFQLPILIIQFMFDGLRWLTALSLTKKFFALRLGRDSWAGRHDLPWWLVIIGWILFITIPGRLVTTAGFVRLLTVGIAPGRYKRGGATHMRFWAAERFVALGRLGAIAGTQWCEYYAWLLGCSVGKDVQIHSLPPTTGLASFGDGSVVEPEADVGGWWLDGDVLCVGTVTIGDGAKIEARSVLMPDTILEPFSVVAAGTCAQGRVRGPDITPSSNEKMAATTKRNFWTDLRYTSSLLLIDFLPILMIAPAWGLTPTLVHDYADFKKLSIAIIYMTLPGSIIGTVLYALAIIMLVRLASSAIRPGVYSWHRSTAWAVWFIHFLVIDARTILFPIYASLFTPNWLRLLGARIGNNVEASTVVPIPSLLKVQDKAFLADDVLTSPGELEAGCIRLGISSVGEQAFVGNSVIVHPEIAVPDRALIGVLATAPASKRMQPGSSWLGRPQISLPRKVEVPLDQSRTFKPARRLVIYRALVESCRLTPLIFASMLQTLVGLGMLFIMDTYGVGQAILASSVLLFTAGIVSCIIAIVAKWVLTPVIRPGQQHPLWSSFVWRNELADTFIQSLAVPMLIRQLYGTSLLSLWLRSLGAKIGRGAWLESHLLPEAELVTLGAGATVNRGCVLQTHLFHDRILRLDKVEMAAGATLGPFAIALPGTVIGSGTTIGPISLVMRGENVPINTRWLGNPVRPWIEETVESSRSSAGGGSSTDVSVKKRHSAEMSPV